MALKLQERQALELKNFADMFIAPLQMHAGEGKDDVIVCAMLEAFLWISTGVQIKVFDETMARRVVTEFLLKPLGQYTKYEETIFRPEHIQEFASFQRSGFIWQGVNAEVDELATIFQGLAMISCHFVNQYSVRSLIQGLRFSSEQVWKQMISQELDDGELVQQFYETERKTANDLTRCAVGALLTIRHVAAFEVMQPRHASLVRRLRAIRDWGFGFGNSVVQSRFLTVIKEIDQYANAVASKALGRRVTGTLGGAATHAMDVWHRGTLGVSVAGASGAD